VKRLIHWLLVKFGYRVVRIRRQEETAPSEGLEPFFALIKKLGFAPKHIIDVGANQGQWTRTAIKYFPEAQYTLVEPQDHLKSYIKDLVDEGYKIQWIHAGAGNAAGTLPFTVAQRDDSSTFALSEEEARKAGLAQTRVAVRTLNEIAAGSGALAPDMVKIDAEGFDLRVLAGASELLGKTEIFLVEACVCCGYENSAAAVVEFMAGAGYRLMDITDLNRSPRHGVLWLCELAFVRKGSGLLEGVEAYE
jgi:FkbM family methyltransferase